MVSGLQCCSVLEMSPYSRLLLYQESRTSPHHEDAPFSGRSGTRLYSWRWFHGRAASSSSFSHPSPGCCCFLGLRGPLWRLEKVWWALPGAGHREGWHRGACSSGDVAALRSGKRRCCSSLLLGEIILQAVSQAG